MGAAWGHMRRWAMNWNFENRAIKFVDRGKKFAAPRYPTEAKVERELRSESHSEVEAELQQKTDVLLDHLKKIKIVSKDVESHAKSETPHVLPQSRMQVPDKIGEYGFTEPDPSRIATGRFAFRDAIDLMTRFSADSTRANLNKILETNPIPPAKAERIVKYFAPFVTQKYVEVILPEEKPMTPGEAYLTMTNVFKTKSLGESVLAEERTKLAAFESREMQEKLKAEKKKETSGGNHDNIEQQNLQDGKRKKELQDADDVVKKI